MTTESHDASLPVLCLVVSYDGAGFVGSQSQPNGRSVQSDLNAVLSQLSGRAVSTTFAGRTDAGVHAAGQAVSLLDPRPDLDEQTLVMAINDGLPSDIAVVHLDRRPVGFHARYDAIWREYRYRVWTGSREPLARTLCWHRREALDCDRMDLAARRLLGERDVAALAGGGEGVPWSSRRQRPRGSSRRIIRCSCRTIDPWWGQRAGSVVEIRVAADGFLPRMVRNIVALLVEMGRGRREIEWIDEVLAGGDRRLGGGTAPPHGLILWRVGYDQDQPEPDERDYRLSERLPVEGVGTKWSGGRTHQDPMK